MREEYEFMAPRTQFGNTTKGDRGGSVNPPRRNNDWNHDGPVVTGPPSSISRLSSLIISRWPELGFCGSNPGRVAARSGDAIWREPHPNLRLSDAADRSKSRTRCFSAETSIPRAINFASARWKIKNWSRWKID